MLQRRQKDRECKIQRKREVFRECKIQRKREVFIGRKNIINRIGEGKKEREKIYKEVEKRDLKIDDREIQIDTEKKER